jgi:hypothetical protein
MPDTGFLSRWRGRAEGIQTIHPICRRSLEHSEDTLESRTDGFEEKRDRHLKIESMTIFG